MARRNKSGRFTRQTKTRRRSKPKANISNIAVSAIVANGLTEGMFNANLLDFFTGKRDGKMAAGGDGAYRLTLPEILGFRGAEGFGGTYGNPNLNFGKVVMENTKANAMQIIGTAVLVPMVANAALKVLRKPVILPANRLLKSTGLDVKLG